MAQSRPRSSKPLLPPLISRRTSPTTPRGGGIRRKRKGYAWMGDAEANRWSNRRRNAIAETLASRHHAQSRDAITDMSTQYIGTCMQLCCTKPKPSCASVRFGRVLDNATGSTRSQRYESLSIDSCDSARRHMAKALCCIFCASYACAAAREEVVPRKESSQKKWRLLEHSSH